MTTNTLTKTNTPRAEIWRELMVALGLSIGAAVALGLSRFAYALLLPAMRADLGWTYVEAGALNTANGAGYIVGAIVAAWIASRCGIVRTFIIGFVISVLVLLLTASTRQFSVLFALRTIGGVATAITFILGAGLAAAICPTQNPRRRGALVVLYVAGVSIGLLLSGAALPLILKGGVDRWPEGWIALGIIGLAGLPVAWRAARSVAEPTGGSLAMLDRHEFRKIAPTFAGYTLFGAGYIGYMTFIIALLQKQGGSHEQTVWFWFVLGIVSAISTSVWGRMLGAFHDGRGAALVFVTSMLGALPVLISSSPIAMFISAVLFGGSFLAGPAAVTIVAQRQLPASLWTAAISLLTVGFALGQTVSPILSGAISDATGSIAAGFWISPILLGIAACANLLQRPSELST